MSGSQKLLFSSLSGRFFSAPACPEDVLKAASAASWPDEPDLGAGRVLGWCANALDQSGRLVAAGDTGLYAVSGGVARLWFREDVRKISRAVLQDAVETRSQERFSLPASRLRGRRRSELEDGLRGELLAAVHPKRTISPVVYLKEQGLLWVGVKSAQDDIPLLMMLRSVFPDAAPMRRFCFTRLGSETFFSRILSRCCSSGEPHLADDVRLSEVSGTWSGTSLRWSWGRDANLEILRDFSRRDPSPQIRSMKLSICVRGIWRQISLDKEGVYSVAPPRSRGGFMTERYARYFSDAVRMIRRCGEAVSGGDQPMNP